MSESTVAKSFLGAIVALGAYLANCIDAILVVLAILMIMDYIAGVTLALMNGEFDPKKGVRGAVKKVFYIFLVLLGFLLDFVILQKAGDFGIGLDTGGLFGIAVTIYLIGNEGFSILQSLVGIGLPVPEFIMKAFGYMKDQAGKIVKIPKNSGDEDDDDDDN